MKKRLLIITLLIILVFLVLNPEQNIDAFFLGIQVWATAVLPALFPFFFFTKFLSELNFPETMGKYLSPLTKRLYRTSGISGYIFVMSILSGYPVGAKLTSDIYEMKIISKAEASRITAYTSTSGPLFIIGTVGIGLFKSKVIGIIILVSHILGAMLNGLIYRNLGKKNEQPLPNTYETLCKVFTNKNVLEDCMFNSIKSILIIGGYVAIFFVIINILNIYNFFLPIYYILSSICPSMDFSLLPSILNGIIEVTRGCLDLSLATSNPQVLTILGTFLISFGGFSVHFQAYTFLKKVGISFKLYLLEKVSHMGFSTLLAFIFSIIIF